MASVEGWFLRAMLSVSVVAWLALVLAELGLFHLELLLVLIAIAGLVGALRGRFRPTGTPSAHRRPAPLAAAGFGALLLLPGVLLYAPPYEAVVGGGDGSVYVNFGRKVALTGTLEFQDAFVTRLPAEVRREVFGNRLSARDVSGDHPRFPGGLRIPDIDDPSVTAGFSPLFPVLIALFHELGSLRAAFFVAPFFASLSLGALFLVATHLGGVWTGALTAALTLGLLPQIWFARFPAPEVVAQCLLLSGLLAWLVALRDDAPRWAVAAGWLLGMAAFAKVDLNVLLWVSFVAFAAWRCFARRTCRTVHVVCLLVPFGLVFLHNVVHYLAFATHYRPFVEHLVRTSILAGLPWPSGGAGLAALLVLVAAASSAGVALLVRCPAPLRRRAWGALLIAVLAGYAINYAVSNESMLGETVQWLSWYVSWPVLLLALAGVAVLAGVGRALRSAGADGPALLLAVFAVVCLHYLYDPLESGVQIWSMRRFVPVVLPLAMLGAALAATAALRRVPSAYRPGVAVVLALVLVDLVARPALAVVRQPLWEGTVAETERLARRFPADAVVLLGSELAYSHLATSLGYLHDLDTVLVQPEQGRSSAMADAIDTWLARGRRVFFIFGDREQFSFFAPRLALRYVEPTRFNLVLPERTRSHAPRESVSVSARLHLLEVGRRESSRTELDVGNPMADVFFSLRGFHYPERHADGDLSFRWTGPEAGLTLPAGGNVELTVAGVRPSGAAPAEVSVRLGGRLAVDRRVLDGGLETLFLSAPAESGPVDLEIESTVFEPGESGDVEDDRVLGVRVYRVRFGVPDRLPTAPSGDGTAEAPRQ
jgi:hypothetical protein